MNKEDLKMYGIAFGILIIMILVIYSIAKESKIPETLEKNKNYRYGWICSEYKFKSSDDAKFGWGCLLDQCQIVSNNPRIEECICALNNLTVNRICTRETYLREYPYPTHSKPQEIKLNQTQYNQTIGGKE